MPQKWAAAREATWALDPDRVGGLRLSVVYCTTEKMRFVSDADPEGRCLRHGGTLSWERCSVCPDNDGFSELTKIDSGLRGTMLESARETTENMVYTSDELKTKSLVKLREIATALDITTTAKPPGQLMKEILSKQVAAPKEEEPEEAPPAVEKAPTAVKKTLSKPVPEVTKQAPVLPAPAEAPPLFSEEEAQRLRALSHLSASVVGELQAGVAVLQGQMKTVVSLLGQLCAFCEVPMPEHWQGPKVAAEAPHVPEAAAEEAAPAKRRGRPPGSKNKETAEAAPAKKAAAPPPPPPPEPEDVGPEDDDEDVEGVEINDASLSAMGLPELQKLAKKINKLVNAAPADQIDIGEKNPKVLRAAILEFMQAFGDMEVDEEPQAASSPATNGVALPFKVGDAVEVEVEGEGWVKALITAMDEAAETAELEFEDGTGAEDVGLDLLRPVTKKAKPR